jgi:hypothetical protein
MQIRERSGDLVMAIAVLAIGVAALVGSLSYVYQTEFGPDAGFFPFWLGLAQTAVGAALVWTTIRARHEPHTKRPIGTRRQFGTAAAFIAYVVVLPLLGFSASTFVFLAVVLALVEARPWLASLLYAAGGTASFVMLFEWAFRLKLPAASIF